MKAGLKAGQAAELEITVNQDMLASFGGQMVHELYASSALVHHMEWVARRTILPYLEKHEEGMGCHLNVEHKSPTLPGMKVHLKAIVTSINGNKVECTVEAFNANGQIARGTIMQSIVEKSWLKKKLEEMSKT